MTPPMPGVMVGITHTTDGLPILRTPRVLKVGIGVPKGRANYVYTHQGKWIIRWWSTAGEKPAFATEKFNTRAEAEGWYHANKKNFSVSKYPHRLPFFTFTRRMMVENGKQIEEVFEPDFATIEAHGDTPREIDIVFMADNPLHQELQAWSATELKCHGDGVSALRVVQLGNKDFPGWSEAQAAGQKYFPVADCLSSGRCPFVKGAGGLICKPMTTLSFQLAKSLRLGATAYLSSTGIRTAQQLFSSISGIQEAVSDAGFSIRGVPMVLTLTPYRTNHDGKPATQYAMSIELRKENVEQLRRALSQASWRAPSAPRVIAEEDVPLLTAGAVTAEFFPEAEVDGEESPEPETGSGSATAREATEQKTEALAEKLKAQRKDADVPAGDAAVDEVAEKWRKRIAKDFLEPLGVLEFCAVLHSITGSDKTESITAENHSKVYDAMIVAKKKAEAAAEAPQTSQDGSSSSGQLF